MEQLHARDLGHVEIEQHHVEPRAPEDLQGFLAPPAQRDVVAGEFEHAAAAFAQCALIVDDQDPQGCLELRVDRQE